MTVYGLVIGRKRLTAPPLFEQVIHIRHR
jgi:hypothetical protein